MEYKNIIFKIQDNVAVLTLNRPEALNSLNTAIMDDMRDAFKLASEEKDIKALVITGAGKGFCAGADLAGTSQTQKNEKYAGLSVGEMVSEMMKSHYNQLILDIDRLEKPVISAVNGVTAGGGVGLALAADIVIAARSASFVLVFGPKLGIVPDMGSTWFLPRLIGRARSLGLGFLGERLSAEIAEKWGLIYKCVDDQALMDEAMAIATKLASGPTKAYGYIKRAFSESERNRLDDQLEFERYCQLILCDSEDFMEGVNSFIEKRKPVFKGR
jgi:2-(1,2-epoxy-1,2-dihydrophenyl)acetyl-CoA isomerase